MYGFACAAAGSSKHPLPNSRTQDQMIDTLSKLYAKGVDINKINKNGYTSLMLACISGLPEVVDFLLKHTQEVNIDYVTSEGVSALSLAVHKGHRSIARQLVIRGATVTPLCHTVEDMQMRRSMTEATNTHMEIMFRQLYHPQSFLMLMFPCGIVDIVGDYLTVFYLEIGNVLCERQNLANPDQEARVVLDDGVFRRMKLALGGQTRELIELEKNLAFSISCVENAETVSMNKQDHAVAQSEKVQDSVRSLPSLFASSMSISSPTSTSASCSASPSIIPVTSHFTPFSPVIPALPRVAVVEIASKQISHDLKKTHPQLTTPEDVPAIDSNAEREVITNPGKIVRTLFGNQKNVK